MSATLAVPRTLSRTLEQVRAIELAELGFLGIPAPHWPLKTGNDCLGFQTWALGIREPGDFTTALISIRAFRASVGWPEVGPEEIRAGDLPLWDWDGDREPDHIEFCYSIDHPQRAITTVSANTGPKPGVDIDVHPELRGVYRKTRSFSGSLYGAIRPPYAHPALTSSDLATVRRNATYLNRVMPATFHDPHTGRTLQLHRSGAGDGSGNGKKGDGKRGPFYRLMVQVWGRLHPPLYPHPLLLDAIFGPHSERVEARLTAVAKRAPR